MVESNVHYEEDYISVAIAAEVSGYTEWQIRSAITRSAMITRINGRTLVFRLSDLYAYYDSIGKIVKAKVERRGGFVYEPMPENAISPRDLQFPADYKREPPLIEMKPFVSARVQPPGQCHRCPMRQGSYCKFHKEFKPVCLIRKSLPDRRVV